MRREAINKLEYFIKNPGYFSILLLGDNGTGKSFIINQVLSKIGQKDLKHFYPFEIGENEIEIEEIFKSEFIIIKNVEEISEEQQDILFKALSTNDGKIGLGDNREKKRIIFTSSIDVSELRENRKHLKDRFWDRISQLVIKTPSFKEFSSEIKADFKSVWEKMQFNEFPKLPVDVEFEKWLQEHCQTFSGNFRDLDKIAILWHQYRIIEYKDAAQKYKVDTETRIFRKVREDFEKLNHFPTQKSDGTNTFEFVMGNTWEKIERDFQSTFKAWAKKNYKTINNATKELKNATSKNG
ncbi:MAG: ATP-binding protein [Bacteroidetes bacterium]|nr:ATP-binding protein [Bacteroidota bacterium]